MSLEEEVQQEKDAASSDAAAKRFSNQYLLQSLDSMLKGGLGSGLSKFVARRACRKLSLHEERYFVDATKVNAAVLRAEDPPGRKRSCIRNTLTGKRWFELPISRLPDGRLGRACIHINTGQGPIGHPNFFVAVGRAGCARNEDP